MKQVRNEIRTNFNATNRQTLETGTNGVVRAQGEVRGTVGKAANDVRQRVARRQAWQNRPGRRNRLDQRVEEFRRHRQEGSQGGAAGR